MAADLTTLTSALRTRLQMAEPTAQTDPLLNISDSDLQQYITDAISAHNPSYTVSTLPSNEVQFVLWLAMIEVYYAIASQAAMNYEIEAQGARLNKQQIFDHYQTLAKQLQDKYDKSWEKFMMQSYEVETAEVLLDHRYTPRTYRLSSAPTTTLSVIGQTSTTIDLQWTAITDRQILGYRLYQYGSEIIDEFAEYPQEFNLINPQATPLFYNTDCFRTKFRVKNLAPNSINYFCLFVEDAYGRKCWSEISIQQPASDGQPISPIITTNNSTPTSVN